MEADWEVEIGPGAAVIDADWSGVVDLRTCPERIGDIAEAREFPPLARLLASINGEASDFWTSKCDVWESGPSALACYVDLLPRLGAIFSEWQQAEAFCRKCVDRLNAHAPLQIEAECIGREGEGSGQDFTPEISITLVVRAALAKQREGFGITAYLAASSRNRESASAALAQAVDAFVDALVSGTAPAIGAKR